jgi:DNA-directed RNA polymerase subunit M/transcription elongation factor TFIIS
MTDPTCPQCDSSEVGYEQTQTFCGVAESNVCDDCGNTTPFGILR